MGEIYYQCNKMKITYLFPFLQKSLQPPLPPELALSFYMQGWKLIFGVYHIVTEKGVSRQERQTAYNNITVVPYSPLTRVALCLGSNV